MKFAGHAALFFSTQGQEFARKAAQVVLDALLFGDVVMEADETGDLAGSVGEGDGASMQGAGPAVRHDVTREMLKGCVRDDGGFWGLFCRGSILEAHQGPNVFYRNRAGEGFEAEHAEELGGASHGGIDGIHFPAAQLGDLFGLREKRFAFSQAILSRLLGGDVLRRADDADDTAGVVGNGNGAGVEDAGLRVGQDEAHFVFERTLVFDKGGDFLRDARAVVGMKQSAGLGELQRLIVRGKSEHAVHLRCPGEDVLCNVEFPAAEAGELLGLSEE